MAIAPLLVLSLKKAVLRFHPSAHSLIFPESPGKRSLQVGRLTSPQLQTLFELPLFEIALVLVRLGHVTGRVINANHNIM